VVDDARNEYLIGHRHRPYSCADVDAQPGEVASGAFELSGVNAGAHRDAELLGRLANLVSAAHCVTRTIEQAERAVAGDVDEPTTALLDLEPHVPLVDRAERAVA